MASNEIDQSIFLFTAFWMAVSSYRGPHGSRFVLALVLGAGLTRVAWAGLHFEKWLEAPWSLVDATGGFCVLALPLGFLLVAPYGTSPWIAQAYRASAARAGVGGVAYRVLLGGLLWRSGFGSGLDPSRGGL